MRKNVSWLKYVVVVVDDDDDDYDNDAIVVVCLSLLLLTMTKMTTMTTTTMMLLLLFLLIMIKHSFQRIFICNNGQKSSILLSHSLVYYIYIYMYLLYQLQVARNVCSNGKKHNRLTNFCRSYWHMLLACSKPLCSQISFYNHTKLQGI